MIGFKRLVAKLLIVALLLIVVSCGKPYNDKEVLLSCSDDKTINI